MSLFNDRPIRLWHVRCDGPEEFTVRIHPEDLTRAEYDMLGISYGSTDWIEGHVSVEWNEFEDGYPTDVRPVRFTVFRSDDTEINLSPERIRKEDLRELEFSFEDYWKKGEP